MSAGAQIEEKMKAAGQSQAAIHSFLKNLEQFEAGSSGFISESSIDAVKDIPALEDINVSLSQEERNALLAKTTLIKLNGGLGTGMGLDKAKSLLEVKDGLTFLDLIVRQVLHLRKEGAADLKFLFMNSFSTSEDTKAFLQDYPEVGSPSDLEFIQSQVPKLDAETKEPVTWKKNPQQEWCPPGHGDIYAALLGSGKLDDLIEAGIEYAFVSNSDNLGACPDPTFIHYMEQNSVDFLMEVTRRTDSDKKGGHLAQQKGRFILRESAQCAEEDKDAFQNIDKHRYFNTNNLWIRLRGLKELIDSQGGSLSLPLITNQKTVDPKDSSSTSVIQLETAMGSAIGLFKKAAAIDVPRSRFAPVKKTDDLLVLRSDACVIRDDQTIGLIDSRNGIPPSVSLSGDYKTMAQFDSLIPVIPSLQHCQSLEVEGPVLFNEQVQIRGEVTIQNNGAEPKSLPACDYEDETIGL
ncbi:MAG: UTP--glucose-1-phosphate uridylyltransferase [Verrucomicrobiota bacterium]